MNLVYWPTAVSNGTHNKEAVVCMTHYEMTVEATDRKVEYLLRSQVRKRGSGTAGILSEERNLVEPKFSIYSFKTLVSAYCCRDSRYFESSELLDAIKLPCIHPERPEEDGSRSGIREFLLITGHRFYGHAVGRSLQDH